MSLQDTKIVLAVFYFCFILHVRTALQAECATRSLLQPVSAVFTSDGSVAAAVAVAVFL